MDTSIIERLNGIVKKRKEERIDNSYTCTLLQGGENRIIKKLGEENAEFIRALLVQSQKEMIEEAADYIYHLIVALRFKDVDFIDVLKELETRHLSSEKK